MVAGGNGYGYRLDQLRYPQDVSVAADGTVIVGDTDNHRVVAWAPGATEGALDVMNDGRE